MWSDSPGTSVTAAGNFYNRPGLGQCDRPGPDCSAIIALPLAGCNNNITYFSSIRLLLATSDWRRSPSAYFPSLLSALLSSSSRLHFHVLILVFVLVHVYRQPRNSGDVLCQDAVNQRLLKGFAASELRSSCSSSFILILHVRMHQRLFTWCSLYNLFLDLNHAASIALPLASV
jgi:hypothetical protein